MDTENTSAVERVFAIPELLEHVLSFLPCELLQIENIEAHPSSYEMQWNAGIQGHLLRCTQVSRAWYRCILGSKRLKQHLYLLPEHSSTRSWDRKDDTFRYYRIGEGCPRFDPTQFPTQSAPVLNPMIQVVFPAYNFRFWHLELRRFCAYLIIARRDIPAVHLRNRTGQGKSLSSMLLSQPPCTELRATIWEERDETRDYVGRTTALRDSIITCANGVTLGMVHEQVKRMFDQHSDVVAIKLTTVERNEN